MPPAPGESLMDRDDYTELLAHERHIEGRAYTALGHFLAANAFMYTAWATLYAVDMEKTTPQARVGMDIVLVSSVIVGYFWGLWWSALGRRNWSMARRLVINLHELGRRSTESGTTVPHLYEILSTTEMDGRDPAPERVDRYQAKFKWSTNPSILSFTPLMMSGIYVALFVLWLLGRFAPPSAWLLLLGAIAVWAVVYLGILVARGILDEMCLETRVTAAMKAAGVERRIEDLWARFPKSTKAR